MTDTIFHIEGNEYSPTATFYADGKLVIKGESRLENPREFYDQLDILLQKHFVGNNPKIIEFYFEYISSSSVLCLISLIKKLIDNKEVAVFWFHDEMDEDIQELGEIIKDTHGVSLSIKSV